MNSRFLDICQLGNVEQGTGSGDLLLSNYCGTMTVKPLFLMLEGIHQVAVRAGKKVIEGASGRDVRVLPVNINQLEQLNQVELKDYSFTCEATPFGPSARVSVQVMDQNSDTQVAHAQITVARL